MSQMKAHSQFNSGLAAGIYHHATVFHGIRQGLFAKDVLACLRSVQHLLFMNGIGGTNIYRPDTRICEEGIKIIVC